MTNEQVVRRYFECVDAEDWDALRALFDDAATLQAVGARTRSGVDDVMTYFPRAFAPWAEHRDAPTRLVVSGDVVTAEVAFAGTTRDGQEVTFEAVDIFDLRDGRITGLSSWYDIDYVRRALGSGVGS
jgi:uncharacterized protein